MTTIRRVLAAAATAAIVLSSGAAARALPGQQLPAWLTWTKTVPVLRHLGRAKDEMSGGTVYNTTVKAAGLTFYFSAEPGGDSTTLISEENLAVQHVPETYDLRKHRPVAATMARVIYGPAVSADLLRAAVVGDFPIYNNPQRLTFLKGTIYAYQLNGPGLLVFRKSELASALKNAKFCATHECGD